MAHKITLSWTPSADGGAVNVYRANGETADVTKFSQIKSGLTEPSYDDTDVSVGTYSYYVTTTVNGAESAPSDKITLTVSPLPPTGLAGVAY